MSSWTDLNISDSLKAACQAVRAESDKDFGAFVEQKLKEYGVTKSSELSHQQHKMLEEAVIAKFGKAFNYHMLKEAAVHVDPQGRDDLVVQEEKVKDEGMPGDQEKLDVDGDGKLEASDFKKLRAGEKPATVKEELDALHRTTTVDNTADAAAAINKITDEEQTPVPGKVAKEPGVRTAAADSLSPGEKSKIEETAKKLGLTK